MAQPSTQQQLLAGNASEYFWYAQGAGMYDARNNAMLTKTGSAGMATEGGANVVLGDGATHYSLPAAISTAQPWTIIFKARIDSAAGTDCVVCGDTVTGNDFVRFMQDTGQVRILANGAQVSWTSQTFNALATWALVSSGTTVTLYKDGVAQGAAQAIGSTALLNINRLLDGYPGGTFRLKGSLEFVNVIPSALDVTAIAARSADPYSVLTGSSNAAPTFSGPNIGNLSGTVGTALTSNTVSDSFSDSDALSFSAIGSWPAGVSVSSGGVISGTPTTAGTYAALKVRATDTAAQTVDSDTFSFTIAASAGTGTITTGAMKNNTGTVLASLSGWSVNVYHASTGALIVQKTGLTTSAGGVLTITDAAIVAGTTYAYEPVHATYGRRSPTGVAS